MASYSPSQSISYRCGAQGCPCEISSLQERQRGSMPAEGFSLPAYRFSPMENALWNQVSSSSSNSNVALCSPNIGLNTPYLGYDRTANAFLDFPACSNRMLLPTYPSLDQNDQQRHGDDAFDNLPPYVASGCALSIFNFQAHSVPDEPLSSELNGFLGANENRDWNQGFSIPFNDALPSYHADCWLVPPNIGDGHANHLHALDRGILDMLPTADARTISLPARMQHQMWDTSVESKVSSYDLYSPFQIKDPWDEALHQNMEDITLSLFQDSESLDYTFQNFESLISNTMQSIPTKVDVDTWSKPLEPPGIQELRNLVPKPPFQPSDALGSIDSNEPVRELSSNLGRRRGLTEEERTSAALVRHLGSCARCTIRKTKCTEGDVCAPCQYFYSKYTLKTAPVCPRGRLDQYIGDIFPHFIFAHLDEPDMRSFLSNVEFTDTKTRVHLSLGHSYPSIPLVVSAFRGEDEKFSHVPDLTSTLNDNMQSFATIATSQMGVRPPDVDQLAQTCVDYLEIIDSQKKSRTSRSRITRDVLNMARRFQQASANQDALLRKAIEITEIFLLMGKRFFFNRESSLEGVESSVTLPPESSRFLNRQIKSAYFLQLRKLIPEALKLLDGRLRHQQKETWAASLLTHLLFCSYVEQVQIAVDAFIFSKIDSEGADHIYTRQHGRGICRQLEHRTLEHTAFLLDGILNGITKKQNLFQNGAQMNGESGLNEAEKNMVNDIIQMVNIQEKEIRKRGQDNYYGGLSRFTSDHKKFRERNPGRLVSKVLWNLRTIGQIRCR